MADARTKRVGTRGSQSQRELYFQLSVASGEEARLRSQLEMLRSKEQDVLARLEKLGQHMARLQKEIDAMVVSADSLPGQGQNKLGYKSLGWEVTELNY